MSALSGKVPRTHSSQWAVLVQFVEDHPEMVTHKFVGINGRENFKRLWEDLAKQLNSMGFGIKTAKKWQEVFGKWKSKIKMKAQDIICGMNKTGAGGSLPQLTPIEERLMAIIGWKVVTGDENKEMGVENHFRREVVADKQAEENMCECPGVELDVPPLIFIKKPQSPVVPAANYSPSIEPTARAVIPQNSIPITVCQSSSSPQLISIPQSSSILAPQSFQITAATNVPRFKATVEAQSTVTSEDQSAATTCSNSTKTKPLNRKRKLKSVPTRSSISRNENYSLMHMHQQNLEMLENINSNLGRIADNQIRQNELFAEILGSLRSK